MKRVFTVLLAALMLCAAFAPRAAASGELRAIADSTIIVVGDRITRVAGIPTAAELKAQLKGDGDIAVVGVADGERVPNGASVTCGDLKYTAVISGDVHADARLNARDVIATMTLIIEHGEDAAADVDLDGETNARDVVRLMNHIVGKNAPVGAEYFAYSETPVAAEREDPTLSIFFGDNLTKKDKNDASVDGAASDLIRLAKNEIEFTQFFLTSEKERGDLSVEATDFVSLKGDVMESELLAEHYYSVKDAATRRSVRYADALPPADVYPFKLPAGESQGFVIKAKSTADTPAGLYRAKISVRDEAGNTVKRADVYARVWNFALSDKTECKTAFGLSSYNIYAYHRMYDGDDGELYCKYYDFMLENRLSAYYLPYSVLDERADKYMSDPRVTSFMIDGRDHPHAGITPETIGSMSDAELAAAYAKLSANEDWMKKGYFYYVDEPYNTAMADEVKESADRLKNLFPEYRLTVPYFTNNLEGLDMTEVLRDNGVNLWTPLSDFWTHIGERTSGANVKFDNYAVSRFGTAEERFADYVAQGDELWWYVCIVPQYPYANFFSTYQGTLTRVLFWQQYMYGIDGVLYWAVNDWQDGAEWRSMDYGFAYGDGRLIYCGQKYKIQGPISSIRLEMIRDGIEDFQYMKMAEASLGKAEVDRVVASVTTGILKYTKDADVLRAARNALGEALEAALAP